MEHNLVGIKVNVADYWHIVSEVQFLVSCVSRCGQVLSPSQWIVSGNDDCHFKA